MRIFRTIDELQFFLRKIKLSGKKVGFVPTMGALHEGHLYLIKRSKAENEVTVCSIFVNPTQFNDKSDFKKYPRVLDSDIPMLEEVGCDILFIPDTEEIYRGHQDITPDLLGLEGKWEGAFRPGHFNGVVQIVYLLLKAVEPDRLYMGLKDFQQQAIIGRLIQSLNLNVELIPVEIIREPSGLAMSSRNARLSGEQRAEAAIIHETLQWAAEEIRNGVPIEEILAQSRQRLKLPGTELEYLEYCRQDNLDRMTHYSPEIGSVILVAIWWGKVRLIDNEEV